MQDRARREAKPEEKKEVQIEREDICSKDHANPPHIYKDPNTDIRSDHQETEEQVHIKETVATMPSQQNQEEVARAQEQATTTEQPNTSTGNGATGGDERLDGGDRYGAPAGTTEHPIIIYDAHLIGVDAYENKKNPRLPGQW